MNKILNIFDPNVANHTMTPYRSDKFNATTDGDTDVIKLTKPTTSHLSTTFIENNFNAKKTQWTKN